MALKPWYKVATPREDLRKGEPLDASEFAIHLDQVVEGRAPKDYQEPERFFPRTCMTAGIKELAKQVLRRLYGETVGCSPVTTLTTQFGGGKTHGLVLLHHLAKNGEDSHAWPGVSEILKESGLSSVPKAIIATFVGTQFDPVKGRGGDGEPVRRTPWGEMAWQIAQQLGDLSIYEEVEAHDRQGIRPGGEVLRHILRPDRPILILVDEALNYFSAVRGTPLHAQFHGFLQVLCTEASARTGLSLVLSLPKSQLEMTPEDVEDQRRLGNLAGRMARPLILSEGLEIAEIIRRRLFESAGNPEAVRATCDEFARWVVDNRDRLPGWFPVDRALQEFEAAYPFHPIALSVFERKWQTLPSFQRTRGVLKMLALWVSRVYRDAFAAAYPDPLVDLGTAPLSDSLFRAEVFEQLGEQRLEAAVLSDIAGEEAWAVRLDAEAPDIIKQARLHQKVATAIFFESSGGQVQEEATLPEVRLAVGEPQLDLGNIETVLANLEQGYYFYPEGTRYRFSHKANIKRLVADRRATISDVAVEERVREEVRKAFAGGAPELARRYFPEDSSSIPDAPSLTLIVVAPERAWQAADREITKNYIEKLVLEYSDRGRTYKSALLFAVASSGHDLQEEARNLLALESLEDEAEQLRLDDAQQKQLQQMKDKTKVEEKVWSAYQHLVLLGDDGMLQELPLGLLHPSARETFVGLICTRLKQEDILRDSISPGFLGRNWPPALEAWATKQVRDTFFASPKFPRLDDWRVLRITIAQGVRQGQFGYASRAADGSYHNVAIDDPAFGEANVEFSEEVVLLPREVALRTKAQKEEVEVEEPEKEKEAEEEKIRRGTEVIIRPEVGLAGITWSGEVEPRQWMNFSTKVLSRFAGEPGLTVRVDLEAFPPEGVSQQKVEETKAALKELGLSEQVQEVKSGEYSRSWDREIEGLRNHAGKEGGEGEDNPQIH